MKNLPLSLGVQLAVVAIVVLGMVGGGLIVAHSGFGTSPKYGGPSTFVPAPQAYFLAAVMYGMSVIGMLALLQNRQASGLLKAFAVLAYTTASTLLVVIFSPR